MTSVQRLWLGWKKGFREASSCSWASISLAFISSFSFHSFCSCLTSSPSMCFWSIVLIFWNQTFCSLSICYKADNSSICYKADNSSICYKADNSPIWYKADYSSICYKADNSLPCYKADNSRLKTDVVVAQPCYARSNVTSYSAICTSYAKSIFSPSFFYWLNAMWRVIQQYSPWHNTHKSSHGLCVVGESSNGVLQNSTRN